MNIQLITVGKLKEKYWQEACAEYAKRLGKYCRFEIVELAEEKLAEKPSKAQIEQGLMAEGKRILSKLSDSSLVIALCIEGKPYSSEQLAQRIDEAGVKGKSNISFLIGSSFGLGDDVKKKADIKLSMSPMTFPHQLARVMLCEQVYRAFSILNHEKYHK